MNNLLNFASYQKTRNICLLLVLVEELEAEKQPL